MLFGCGGLFGVSLAAGFGYLAWANAPLPPPDPEQPLPNPNAYYVCVESVANRPLSSTDSPLARPDSSSLTQLRKALAKPDSAGEKVRAALVLEYRNPPIRDYDTLLPELLHYRQIAKRWTAEARVARSEGRPEVAIDRSLDAVELGSRIPHGGGLMLHLVGVACQLIPLKQAELAVPELSAAAARQAGQRLDRIIRQAPPATELVEVERWAGTQWLRQIFARNHAALKAVELNESTLAHPLVMAFYPKPWSYGNLDAYYRASLAEMKKPYPAQVQPEVSRDPFCMMLLPAFSGASSRMTERDAALHLLRLELALQEYRKAHGRYPARLEQLVPRFVAKLPADPFTTQPFRYRSAGDGYRLYSLGYDGIDDGGRPIANRETSISGSGDLVVGQLWPGY